MEAEIPDISGILKNHPGRRFRHLNFGHVRENPDVRQPYGLSGCLSSLAEAEELVMVEHGDDDDGAVSYVSTPSQREPN